MCGDVRDQDRRIGGDGFEQDERETLEVGRMNEQPGVTVKQCAFLRRPHACKDHVLGRVTFQISGVFIAAHRSADDEQFHAGRPGPAEGGDEIVEALGRVEPSDTEDIGLGRDAERVEKF